MYTPKDLSWKLKSWWFHSHVQFPSKIWKAQTSTYPIYSQVFFISQLLQFSYSPFLFPLSDQTWPILVSRRFNVSYFVHIGKRGKCITVLYVLHLLGEVGFMCYFIALKLNMLFMLSRSFLDPGRNTEKTSAYDELVEAFSREGMSIHPPS